MQNETDGRNHFKIVLRFTLAMLQAMVIIDLRPKVANDRQQARQGRDEEADQNQRDKNDQ